MTNLQRVENDLWQQANRLLKESKVEYRNECTDTEFRLVLDTFVGESLVLRAYTPVFKIHDEGEDIPAYRSYFIDREFFDL